MFKEECSKWEEEFNIQRGKFKVGGGVQSSRRKVQRVEEEFKIQRGKFKEGRRSTKFKEESLKWTDDLSNPNLWRITNQCRLRSGWNIPSS